MDETMEQQTSESNQNVSASQPVVKWAQGVSKWARAFFTLTEQEKDAAGIRDYKTDHL